MILASPTLDIFGVYDRGVPNAERIVLRASGPLDLTPYALILGFRGAGETIFPIADQFLWFGTFKLETPGWVFIYTGQGTAGMNQEQHTKEPIHVVYWNKAHTMLNNPNVLPALIRLDTVIIGNKPNRDVRQLLSKPVPAAEIDWAEILRLLEPPKK